MTNWMDARKSDLNPCSLETISQPVEVTVADGLQKVWPLMLSCYQLSNDDGTRRGQMELHLVKVPENEITEEPLELGKPYTILDPSESSGILDGKWTELSSQNETLWCFASAHSTGEIRMHSFRFGASSETDKPFCTSFLGQSDAVEAGTVPLCLSLHWDNTVDNDQKRIVSTYSNGTVALYDVHVSSSLGATQMVRKEAWQAHTMFQTPTEVWSACIVQDSVISCGDDGSFKVWDIRCHNKPSHVIRTFEAGVTCTSPHGTDPNIFAVGSYDETLCIHDIRYMNNTQSLVKTGPLGGGIWRIKWHPYDSNRILVGAMHGGCRVLEVDGLCNERQGTGAEYRVTKEFTEHESMAYGADWLCHKNSKRNNPIEAAASCSFYDKSVYLWRSRD